ncbi:hypothetical protein N9L68_04095 [bacterium]|nr:hypothetical protein [bacterium]
MSRWDIKQFTRERFQNNPEPNINGNYVGKGVSAYKTTLTPNIRDRRWKSDNQALESHQKQILKQKPRNHFWKAIKTNYGAKANKTLPTCIHIMCFLFLVYQKQVWP